MEERLNKWPSQVGVCSGREADRPIEAGKVLVDNRPAPMGRKITPGQRVVHNGKTVQVGRNQRPRLVLLAVNKPKGIAYTTTDKDRVENVMDFLGCPEWIYPVERLDKDLEGLLLMINQGNLVNKIVRSGNVHEKRYIVTVDKPVTECFLEQMAGGIRLPELGQMTRFCRVKKVRRNIFSITLIQGLSRQIWRMCEACGRRVECLVRVHIMSICLGNLKMSACRQVTKEEYEGLTGPLKDSPSLSLKERKNR